MGKWTSDNETLEILVATIYCYWDEKFECVRVLANLSADYPKHIISSHITEQSTWKENLEGESQWTK